MTAALDDAPALRAGSGSLSYEEAWSAFDHAAVLRAVFPDADLGVNAAFTCCDRHADGGDRVALRYRGHDGTSRDLTFEELRRLSTQLASAFARRGVKEGDIVAGLLPRIPELLVTIVATWRLGAVYQPLFTAFGPRAIGSRLDDSGARVVVTDGGNRGKLDEAAFTGLIVTIGADPTGDDVDFWSALEGGDGSIASARRSLDDPFLIMFTSGTTGSAKPLLVPIKAVAAFVGYMRDAVDLRPDDRFWNIADPGWAYGLYYAVTGPLAMGLTTTFYDGPFTVEGTYRLIEELGITNLAGSPSAFRMLVAAGPEPAARVEGRLRAVSSAGEPLNPEVIRWFADHLAAPIHDHYGQTELGMVLCNHHAIGHPITVGAAGFASPGHHVVVVGDDGRERGTNEPGQLALNRSRSPLMWFSGYAGRDTPSFVGDLYLTGDTAERNADGSISFVGRSDDVITSSGYRIGPFEVESALMEHPAVVESAVIGKRDPERTEIVKAFVVLKAGTSADEALAAALQEHVKKRLSAHAYPREVAFVDELPKTPSGKVQRFLLRNAENAAWPSTPSPKL